MYSPYILYYLYTRPSIDNQDRYTNTYIASMQFAIPIILESENSHPCHVLLLCEDCAAETRHVIRLRIDAI